MFQNSKQKLIDYFKRKGVWLFFIFFPSSAFSAVDIRLIVLPTSEYCRQLEAAFQNLKMKYGPQIATQVSFLVIEDGQGRFGSPLGKNDFEELLRQAVIRKCRPEKLWAYLSCRNSEMYNPVWEHSAQWAGIAPEALDAWVKKETPQKLLAQDRKLVKQYHLQQVPAVMINGVMMFEGQVGLPEIDAAVGQCLNKKQAKLHSALIIHAPQAAQPRLEEIKSYLKRYVIGIHFEAVPTTPELEQELLPAGISRLPAVLMDAQFSRTYYANYFPAGPEITFRGRRLLPVPAYTDSLLDRMRTSGRLRVIMQAYCPASVDLLRQLLEKNECREIPGRLEFPYLLYDRKEENAGTTAESSGRTLAAQSTYVAFHGQQELEETARQLALQKLAPEKYWGYLKQLYLLGFDRWEEALLQAGINKVDLEQYLADHGEQCLREHYEIVKSLPVMQSPVLLTDNRYLVTDINGYFNGKINIDSPCNTNRGE